MLENLNLGCMSDQVDTWGDFTSLHFRFFPRRVERGRPFLVLHQCFQHCTCSKCPVWDLKQTLWSRAWRGCLNDFIFVHMKREMSDFCITNKDWGSMLCSPALCNISASILSNCCMSNSLWRTADVKDFMKGNFLQHVHKLEIVVVVIHCYINSRLVFAFELSTNTELILSYQYSLIILQYSIINSCKTTLDFALSNTV